MSTTEDLKKHLASQGGQTLGAIVTWSLRAAAIPRADFAKAFEDLGLPKAAGRPPKPERLARRAVTDAKAGRPNTLIRELVKDGTKIVWGIINERVEGVADAEANYEQATRVAVIRAGGFLKLEDQDNEVAKDIQARYIHAQTYATTTDLSNALVKALLGTDSDPMLSGMRLAGSGGCYWVPQAKLPQLRELAAWIEKASPESTMTVFEITGSGSNLKNASRSAQRTIRNRCSEILTETRTFVSELRKADPTAELKAGVMATRMKRFDRLKEQAGLYADVLGDIQAELEAEIAEARAEVMGLKEPKEDFAFDEA